MSMITLRRFGATGKACAGGKSTLDDRRRATVAIGRRRSAGVAGEPSDQRKTMHEHVQFATWAQDSTQNAF
jgi:hypothetical protein